MLDLLNAAACAVVFVYCFIASVRMPGRGMWPKRLVIWVVTFSLGIQMMGPWADWVPKPAWQSVLFHVCLALALVVWRREAMAFVHCKFSIPDEAQVQPKRRVTDWAELHPDQAAKVSGGQKMR